MSIQVRKNSQTLQYQKFPPAHERENAIMQSNAEANILASSIDGYLLARVLFLSVCSKPL